VALHLDPFEYEPLPGENTARAADIAEEWRVARHGIEVVAHGALVCPSCDAPMVLAASVPAFRQVECGFCGHTDRARTFLVRDVFDTVANEAYMIARLPG
jgi:Zn ribbon nucleic-acid-binding protein